LRGLTEASFVDAAAWAVRSATAEDGCRHIALVSVVSLFYKDETSNCTLLPAVAAKVLPISAQVRAVATGIATVRTQIPAVTPQIAPIIAYIALIAAGVFVISASEVFAQVAAITCKITPVTTNITSVLMAVDPVLPKIAPVLMKVTAVTCGVFAENKHRSQHCKAQQRNNLSSHIASLVSGLMATWDLQTRLGDESYRDQAVFPGDSDIRTCASTRAKARIIQVWEGFTADG
jgi:hypothetical protein